MSIALKAQANGHYCVVSVTGDVTASDVTVTPASTWTLVSASSGVAFQTPHGYLSAEGGGGGLVHADRPVVGPWETFTPDGAGFRCTDGVHVLCADLTLGPQAPLNATRTGVGLYESFTVERIGGGPSVLLPLRPAGAYLETSDGARWFGLGVSSFPMWQLWRQGGEAAIAPWVDWMVTNQLEVARLMGGYAGGIGDFRPWPGDISDLGTLLDYLLSHGVRAEVTVLADAQVWLPKLSDQQAYVAAVGAIMASRPEHLFDLGNEYPQNGFDPLAFSRPPVAVASRGSNIGDGEPPFPPWDLAMLHPGRGWKFVNSGAESEYLRYGDIVSHRVYSCAIGVDEPIGIDDVDTPGRSTANPDLCRVMGRDGSAHTSLFILHVRRGINAADGLAPPPAGSPTQACVAAAVAAAR